jgi:hypothetical protein
MSLKLPIQRRGRSSLLLLLDSELVLRGKLREMTCFRKTNKERVMLTMYRIGFFRNISGTAHISRLSMASSQRSLDGSYMGIWASDALGN